MNVSGPTPISPRLDDPASAFRLHQRFEAEVLQVAGERVTLTVAGVPIVARMTSPEQAAILTQQRKALFQVQDTAPELRLKLVKGGTAPLGEGAHAEADPAAGLLRFAGLPADELNLQLARACLQNRVVITKEFVAQMRGIIAQALTPPPGEKGAAPGAGASASLSQAAQTAVAWAASGRPLNPAMLALLLQDLPDLTSMIASLRAGLASARSRLAPEDAALLDTALEWLDAIDVELPPKGDLAEKLQKALSQMGRTLEAELAQEAKETHVYERAHSGMYALAQLGHSLAGGEHAALTGEIEQFLSRLNLQNLRNMDPGPGALQEHWLTFEIPCSMSAASMNGQNSPADQIQTPIQLRVLKDPQPGEQAGANGKSRLIIQAEVAPGKVIEVDLSILERRIQVYVSTPDAPTLARANDEMGGLNAGLEKLGYQVQDPVLGVKEALNQRRQQNAPPAAPLYRHADWRA